MKDYKNIDAYIKAAPAGFQEKLREMRALTTKLVPEGEEAIKYGMPTIQLGGRNLVHFAAMKGHLGFYPSPSGVEAFKDELDKLGIDSSKGCIRFPYAKPLPTALIGKVIRLRVREEKAS